MTSFIIILHRASCWRFFLFASISAIYTDYIIIINFNLNVDSKANEFVAQRSTLRTAFCTRKKKNKKKSMYDFAINMCVVLPALLTYLLRQLRLAGEFQVFLCFSFVRRFLCFKFKVFFYVFFVQKSLSTMWFDSFRFKY